MKKFHFSLTAVRELRQAEEQTAQKVFADAVRARELAAARLAAGEKEVQNAWQLLREGSAQSMQVVHIAHARFWCSVLEDRKEQLVEALEKCAGQMKSTHKLLQAAAQRRETMDRMLAKQLRKYEAQAQSEEQKILDELATRGAWHGHAQMEAA